LQSNARDFGLLVNLHAAAVGTAELHPRDALWAAALQTAIARRSGDTGALHKHWYAAMEVLAEYSIASTASLINSPAMGPIT